MGRIRNVNTKRKLDEIVDTSTGECFNEVNITESTDYVLMDYDEYVTIDSTALKYIVANFSPSDYGRIIRMSDMVDGPFNVLHKEKDIPHTNQTLAEELKYSRNKYAEFMKRLHNNGIIYYFDGLSKVKGVTVKHVMLNPYLARKKKMFNKQCFKYFTDFKIKN